MQRSRNRPTPGRVLTVAAGSLIALLLLSGCSYTMNVELDPRLNQDSPLAVDLVIPYDDALFDQLRQLDAAAWFEARDRFKADHGSELDVQSWEWVPRDAVLTIPLRRRIGSRRAIVFANYLEGGEQRQVIQPLKDFTLDFGEAGFTVRFTGAPSNS